MTEEQEVQTSQETEAREPGPKNKRFRRAKKQKLGNLLKRHRSKLRLPLQTLRN